MEIPIPLLDDISKGRASIFLGAGASAEAGFPTAWELAQHLSSEARLSGGVLEERPLDFVAQYLVGQPGYGKAWVRSKTIEYLENLHKTVGRPPSAAHAGIAERAWRTAFTTNYDRLLEITYETAQTCCQRLLPIYSPDPQVMMREDSVLRLFKLNGSVDEAARNGTHELVFTFQDQQLAKARNSQFYDVLKREAVNGPIVFIGFRFMHPGARDGATSPEFALLQELLREMGASARWHYLVTPLGESVEAAVLKQLLEDCHIHLLNSTFGEFVKSLDSSLSDSRTSTQKGPIVISVADRTISIDKTEYDRDKRHFELLGPHLYESDRDEDTIQAALNGNANWTCFRDHRLLARLARGDLKALIDARLDAEKASMCIFAAPPGWGKTYLLRDLAVDYAGSNRPVFWLNPFATTELRDSGESRILLGRWDKERIGKILSLIHNSLRTPEKQHAFKPLIFVDNCPERDEEVMSLFTALGNLGYRFTIVFSIRDTEYTVLQDSHIYRRVPALVINPDEYDRRAELRDLITLCERENVGGLNEQAVQAAVVNTIVQDEADQALILALYVIFDRNHRPFSEIVSAFWNELGDYAKNLAVSVSSLHRFGGDFYPRLYSVVSTFPAEAHADAYKEFQDCLHAGLLLEREQEGEPCVATMHPFVAHKILLLSELTPVEIDQRMTKIVAHMTACDRDLEVIRRLLKRINDYKVDLSESSIRALFEQAAQSTSNDWVVCQQYSKFLVGMQSYQEALDWINVALKMNPRHASLHHTKGNVLQRWGRMLELQDEHKDSKANYQAASASFAMSRTRPEPDEYGYVTHLDMLIYRLNRTDNVAERANLIAEGAQLYEEAFKRVPADRFNFLLEQRFAEQFNVRGDGRQQLIAQILAAVNAGRASNHAAFFVAQQLSNLDRHDEAISILKRQQSNGQGILPWLGEAIISARAGDYLEASKAIEIARRNRSAAEDVEIAHLLTRWSLVLAFVVEDFETAKRESAELQQRDFYVGANLPTGYLWKKECRTIPLNKRDFNNDAKLFEGRISAVRTEGRFGLVAVYGSSGNTFSVPFNPRYFSRRDFRVGDLMKVVVTILATGLRADDPITQPFADTVDDLHI